MRVPRYMHPLRLVFETGVKVSLFSNRKLDKVPYEGGEEGLKLQSTAQAMSGSRGLIHRESKD